MNISGLDHKFIAIEGNIGAGKTTLAAMLAEYFNARLVQEEFEDNPFLPRFYRDKERYAFPVELSFLAARYRQLKIDLEHGDLFKTTTIADYFIMKSLIFAQITLQQDEMRLYRQFFEMVKSFAPKPDILIYIHRDTAMLLNNIGARGREFERGVDAEYLTAIQKGYFNYFKEVRDYPIVVVDATLADFIGQPNHFNRILDIISDENKYGLTYCAIS